MKTLLSALALLLSVTPALALDGFVGKVLGVRSGDAIIVHSERGESTIRLHGVEWANADPKLPLHARDYLRRRLGTGAVKIAIRGIAPDKSLFADVFLVESERILPEPLSVELARKGLARWSNGFAAGRNDIRAAESNAKAAKLGLWSDPTGMNIPLPPPRAAATPTPITTPTVAPTPQATPAATAAPTAAPSPKPAQPTPSVGPTPTGNPTFEPHPIPKPTGSLVLRAITTIGWPLGGILLALSGWMALPVLQLRRVKRVPISGIKPGLVSVKGMVVPLETPLTTPTGGAPALMYREEVWRYIDSKWSQVRDESEAIPFFIDDGTGQIRVEAKISDFQTSAAATRFYNEVHVPQWPTPPYENDERAQVLYLAPQTQVTVLASAVHNGSGGLRLIRPTIAQGNVKKASNLRARLAAGTFLLALVVFAAAIIALSFIAVEGLPPVN